MRLFDIKPNPVCIGVALAGFIVLSGCAELTSSNPFGSSSTSSNANTETIRVETSTAPTDLQLICASRTAEAYRADENTTLPVSSKNLGDGKYSVKVKMTDNFATCIIDDNAQIITIDDFQP